MITNLINNKKYIRQTAHFVNANETAKGFKGRFKEHIWAANRAGQTTIYLYNAMTHYGIANFETSCILCCKIKYLDKFEKKNHSTAQVMLKIMELKMFEVTASFEHYHKAMAEMFYQLDIVVKKL